MNKEHGSYRHPKHDEIAKLLLSGGTNHGIASQLGVHNQAVRRVREILGLPRISRATSREDKVARFCEALPDGHTGWTGRRTRSGFTPVIRQNGVEMPASHVVFEGRTGRKPVGIVKAECGVEHCLTPAHISDLNERRQMRMVERGIYGLDPQPWRVCAQGLHEWEEYGRIQSDLTPYCAACNYRRVIETRADLKGSVAS